MEMAVAMIFPKSSQLSNVDNSPSTPLLCNIISALESCWWGLSYDSRLKYFKFNNSVMWRSSSFALHTWWACYEWEALSNKWNNDSWHGVITLEWYATWTKCEHYNNYWMLVGNQHNELCDGYSQRWSNDKQDGMNQWEDIQSDDNPKVRECQQRFWDRKRRTEKYHISTYMARRTMQHCPGLRFPTNFQSQPGLKKFRHLQDAHKWVLSRSFRSFGALSHGDNKCRSLLGTRRKIPS